MPQCNSCRKPTGKQYLSFGGRHYHLPSECERFAEAIVKQTGQPKPVLFQSTYEQFCWQLANPEEKIKNVKPSGSESKFFVTSCAQHNTPANMDVVMALETLADYVGGELLIGALRYKNPNAWNPDEDGDDTYYRECDEKLSKWIVNESIDLNDTTVFKVTTGATSLNPLAMARRVTNKNCVVAHPIRQQRPIATPATEDPLLMLSTGSVTYPYNYSMSPTGEAAEFHHSYGGALVQVTEDDVMMWPITYDKKQKCVHWQHKKFLSTGEVEDANFTLILGDYHGIYMKPEIHSLTRKFLQGTRGQCKEILVHDLLNFTTGSHHGDVWTRAQLAGKESPHNSVCDEIDTTFGSLLNLTRNTGAKVTIVASNHNEHLDKWLIGGKNHSAPLDVDAEDLILWHQLNAAVMHERLNGLNRGALETYYAEVFDCTGYIGSYREFNWLNRRDPYYIENIDCSQHGDNGVGGSRGSVGALAKTGRKIFCGHGHADLIEKSAWSVPTSASTAPGYVRGYSTMQNGHGVIYKGGCRGKMPIKGGKFTL